MKKYSKYFLLTVFLIARVFAANGEQNGSAELMGLKPGETPESNIAELLGQGGKVSEEGPYMAIEYYLKNGNNEYAIRAAKKLVALKPEDGKAYGILGFSLIKAGQGEEAIPLLKQAYSLNYKKSIIYLTFYLQQSGRSIAEYVPQLEAEAIINPDAYKPLFFYVLSLSAVEDRRKIGGQALAAANKAKLVEDEEIFNLLVAYYKSISDAGSLDEIKTLRRKFVETETKRLEGLLDDIRHKHGND